MSSLIALAAVAAVLSGSYGCQLEQVAAVSVDGGKATASMIEGLPAESLKFRVVFAGDTATIDWSGSPIQVAGKQRILSTGPDAGMVLAVSPGPCLFTEASCAAMLNYARQPDGSLKILLTPTALSYDSDQKTRSPFLVSMEGRCNIGNSKQ